MIGSSAAALTGLMFVVITLVTRAEMAARKDGLAIFNTPTVLHFSVALLVSAILCAPWRSLVPPAVIVGVAGLYCVAYVLRVAGLARRLTGYVADTEDWVWYAIIPMVAFCTMLGGAVALPFATTQALYAIAAASLLLVFIGIRNAWDVVTFLAIKGPLPPE
ncbi:MAG: hypothetical protein JO003_03180 [Candidatus Eremiobacteraeota bacterium]|nr:hypothetical protein [Candidatus Eremiobacteraeota bacterium]